MRPECGRGRQARRPPAAAIGRGWARRQAGQGRAGWAQSKARRSVTSIDSRRRKGLTSRQKLTTTAIAAGDIATPSVLVPSLLSASLPALPPPPRLSPLPFLPLLPSGWVGWFAVVVAAPEGFSLSLLLRFPTLSLLSGLSSEGPTPKDNGGRRDSRKERNLPAFLCRY